MLMGLGKEARRSLPGEFKGELPTGCQRPVVYLPGTLVVQGRSFNDDADLADTLAAAPALTDWPVVLLVDNVAEATASLKEFLWAFFTRFAPAADIHGRNTLVRHFHVGLATPIVFDCRMKPWYPHVLEVDPETRKIVDEKIGRILPASLR